MLGSQAQTLIFLATSKSVSMGQTLRFGGNWRYLVPFLHELVILYVEPSLVPRLLKHFPSHFCNFIHNSYVEDPSGFYPEGAGRRGR